MDVKQVPKIDLSVVLSFAACHKADGGIEISVPPRITMAIYNYFTKPF